jgi:CrcB protein
MTSPLLWSQALAVAGGAAVGGLARWQVGLWLNARWPVFPLGTLAVNCVGGLLIGIALFAFERTPDEFLRLLLVTGLLGGLTTFSSYSAESLVLLQRGEWALATGHTLAHVLGALLCTAAGYRVGQILLG